MIDGKSKNTPAISEDSNKKIPLEVLGSTDLGVNDQDSQKVINKNIKKYDTHRGVNITEKEFPKAVPEDDVYSNKYVDISYNEKLVGLIAESEYEIVYSDLGEFLGMQIQALPDRKALDGLDNASPTVGDIVTMINGIHLYREEDFAKSLETLYHISEDDKVPIRYLRGNDSFEVLISVAP